MSGDLQFERAQFVGGSHCTECQNALQGSYFRLNASTLCASCAEKARLDHELQRTQGRTIVRPLLFGAGAALLGSALYGGIALVTGFEFALVAIFIGWMVGKAMIRGARGVGGRRLQVLAVLLSYLSITGGYVPSIVKEIAKQPEAAGSPAAGAPGKDAPATAASGSAAAAEPKKAAERSSPARDLLFALAVLFAIAAVAPIFNVTSGVSGILGIVIIVVGLMQAWKVTRPQPFALSGPFSLQADEPAVQASAS